MLPDLVAKVESVPYLAELILTLVTWVAVGVFVLLNGRLFRRIGRELATQDTEDRTVKTLDQIFDFLAVLVGIFVTLTIWGIDQMLYAALTTIGVIGIMLGFAVKDIASNFISGILIILSKDIIIGDAISVNGIEGKVERITIRTSSVRRWDGTLVLVPNSMLVNNPVVNFSSTPKRRVEVPVVMSSGEDIALAIRTLKEVAEAEDRRLEGEEVAVLVKAFEANTVALELRFWVARDDLLTVKSDVHDAIQRAFRDRGLSLDIVTSVSMKGDLATAGGG